MSFLKVHAFNDGEYMSTDDNQDGPVANGNFIGFWLVHHDLYVHPNLNASEHIKKMNVLGHCLCDEERKRCPCMQATCEISEKGKCKCTLFMNWVYVLKWGLDKKIKKRLNITSDYTTISEYKL